MKMHGVCRIAIAGLVWVSWVPALSAQTHAATATKQSSVTYKKTHKTRADVLAASLASDWRAPKPENTLVLEFDRGRVLFELAPDFAPAHIANLTRLVREHYFDDLAVVRVQDNYVAQWGDPNATTPQAKSLGTARNQLDGEYFRPATGLAFTQVDSKDAYASEVGFVAGFPTGRDGATGNAWLLHCYGALGVGRDLASNSGNGAELYAVIGHSPRHLDRNVTLIGRALLGMEHLSSMPRGKGELGFYEPPIKGTRIKRIALASELPASQRAHIEVLRTDTPTFAAWVAASTHRTEDWFIDPAGSIEVCNVPLPTRPAQPNPSPANAEDL